jgi:hypothetical protein
MRTVSFALSGIVFAFAWIGVKDVYARYTAKTEQRSGPVLIAQICALMQGGEVVVVGKESVTCTFPKNGTYPMIVEVRK